MTFEKAKQILKDITNGKNVFDGILDKPLIIEYGNTRMIYIVKTIKGDYLPIIEQELKRLKQIDYCNGTLIAEDIDPKIKDNFTIVG